MKLRNLVMIFAAATSASVAFAQAKPEDQIRYRQGAMQVIGRSFGTLAAMAKGELPFNKDAAARHATVVAEVSDMPLITGAFGPGTDKGAPTKADPKVWSEADKFKVVFEKMVAEARKLPTAAGDLASLKVAVGDVGKTCKGCHDDYRRK